MKKRALVVLLSIATLMSCSRDTDSQENFTDPATADLSTTKANRSDYTSDPNFLTLVDNYSKVTGEIWMGAREYEEPAGSLSSEVILNMAGFSKLEAFRDFQRENSELYYKIAEDHGLKTEAQLRELSDKIKDKSMENLQHQIGNMGCGWILLGCVLHAFIDFTTAVSEIGGVGCNWNPGSGCWEALLSLEADTLWTMQGCVESYLNC